MRITSPKVNTTHITANEEALLRCQRASELKDSGDYEAAREAMDPLWRRVGQRPEIGGLYPSVRLDSAGVHLIGESAEIPFGGEKIELSVSNSGRWVQRHVNSGTEIPLLFPWEIDFASYRESQTFDYLKEAQERFRGKT